MMITLAFNELNKDFNDLMNYLNSGTLQFKSPMNLCQGCWFFYTILTKI